MTYLLDVNALIALATSGHEFHHRVATWIGSENSCVVATCSITELGFVRVLAQTAAYGQSVAQARMLLSRMRNSKAIAFEFIPDTHDVSRLPDWVKTPRQVTDGHLVALAVAHGATFATLDEKIPGSFLIPR